MIIMELGFKEIMEVFTKHGIKGVLGIILTLGLYKLINSEWLGNKLSKVHDSFIEKFMKKETKDVSNIRKITTSDIVNHDIFNYIDFWTYSMIPTLKFSTDYRTAVFRKYLTLYLKSYKSNILKFVTTKEYESMDEPLIIKTFLNLINMTVYEYERDFIVAGIPSIVIEKMKIKNNDNIILTIDLVEGVCSSHFYNSENNLLKVYSILNILMTILESTISNSEDICNSINGALKGMTYDGHIEPSK